MPRPLSEAARQKAIEATLALVAEGGFDSCTMDGVARVSGVAKTTLYRHWSSSNELLVHALDCKVEPIPGPDTGSIRGDLTELFTTMSTIVNTPGNRELILEIVGVAARDPEFMALNKAMMDQRKRPITEMLERAMERAEIPRIDIELATTLVEGPLHFRVLMNHEPVAPDEIPTFVNFVARGLGAPDEA